MPNLRNRFPARRRFLKQSAALTASASLAAPMLVVAQMPAESGDPSTASAAPASFSSRSGVNTPEIEFCMRCHAASTLPADEVM